MMKHNQVETKNTVWLSRAALRLIWGFGMLVVASSALGARLQIEIKPSATLMESVETPYGRQIRAVGPVNDIEGHPSIAIETMNVMLPATADLNSLRIANVEVEKEFSRMGIPVQPAGRLASVDGLYSSDELFDAQGRAIAVYGRPGTYPREVVQIVAVGQMRNIKYVTLSTAKQLYAPGNNHTLYAIKRVVAEIEFATVDQSDPPIDGAGSAILPRIEAQFINSEDVATFYPEYLDLPNDMIDTDGAITYVADYVIITTEEVVNNSSELANFKAHKESLGFRVLIETVEDIDAYIHPDGEESFPRWGEGERANDIRYWLQDKYLRGGYQYLLLIGDPDPQDIFDYTDSYGEVPMKMCWPQNDADEQWFVGTDYYYADLTGMWDPDYDYYFGEFTDDAETGGVDLCAELYVGRLPYDDVSIIDGILQKWIAYEQNSVLPALFSQSWRRSVLLPMSWLDEMTDSAYLAKELMDDFFDPEGYRTFTLYQHESVSTGTTSIPANSIFSSDANLTSNAVVAEWINQPYGIVCWSAHGGATSAWVGNEETGWGGRFISPSLCGSLDDDFPSVVVQMSCENAHSEYNSLAAQLLQNGAIATVAATETAYYSAGAITSYETATSGGGIVYRFIKHLFDDYPCPLGKALYEAKNDMGLPAEGPYYGNLLVFNLYGDPTMEWKVPGLLQFPFGDPIRPVNEDDLVVEEIDTIADWIWE